MKRLIQSVIIFLIVIGIPGFVLSQTWVPTNSAVFVWEAITTLADGTPIPAGQTIQYNVYTALLDTSGVPGPTELRGTTNTNQFTITFIRYGKYYLGVSASLMEGTLIQSTTEVSWSNNPEVCLSRNTFGITYLIILNPKNLRLFQGPSGNLQNK